MGNIRVFGKCMFMFLCGVLTLFFSLRSPAAAALGEECRILRVDERIIEDALVGYMHVPLQHVSPVDIDMKVPSLREVVLFVKSNLSESELSFETKLEVDGERVASGINSVSAGDTIPLQFSLPFAMTGEHEIRAVIDFERPGDFPGWKPVLFTQREIMINFSPDELGHFHFAPFEITIDGNLSEWAEIPAVHFAGQESFAAEIRLAWDMDNVYVSASVNDRKHFNAGERERIWDGDALQLSFVPSPVGRTIPTDLAVAFAAGRVQSYQWMGPDAGLLERSEYIVLRDEENGRTFYEVKIPFECLGIEAETGVFFGFNAVMLVDTDGTGCDYRIGISPDVGWGDLEDFKRFVLLD